MSKSQTKPKKTFTKVEEALLDDFSKKVSKKMTSLLFGNALIVSMLPIWLHWKIFMMELNFAVALIITALSTYFMTLAYRNIQFKLKYNIVLKRGQRSIKLIENKRKSKKKLDTEKLLKINTEAAEFEAITGSIWNNNALFLGLTTISSLILFRSLMPLVNYCASVSGTAGLLALLSTKK